MPWITKERGVYGRHVLRADLTEADIQDVAEGKLSKDQVHRVMRWLVDEAYKALREAQASQLVPDAKYKLIWRKTFYSDWELDT